MCTVSWLRRVDGYELFCNRDERRSRPAAEPPRLHAARGPHFLAPVDGEAGGTWISVNRAGLALCLLNDYQAPEPPAGTELRSRGLLVRDLADAADVPEFTERLRAAELGNLRGFVLLALGPEWDQLALAHWDTRELRLERAAPPLPLLVSSGWNGPEVRARRAELFGRLVLGPDPAGGAADLRARHLAFHASASPEHGAFSPCMHRADAGTVSTSTIRVEPGRALFTYRAAAPCEPGSAHAVDLVLAGPA